MAEVSDDPPILTEWRQGDFALEEIELPIMQLDEGGAFFGAVACPGVALISQSCDIVRRHEDRPFVQVAALSPATADELARIEARKMPRYGFLTPLKPHGLVVDFDSVATVHKQLVASWGRHSGCVTDQEQRDLAAALARHKQRFAFPDGFDTSLRGLRRWIERRAGKRSLQGAMLQAIQEIRVRCSDWSDASPDLDFICLLIGDPAAAERSIWDVPLREMEKTVVAVYPGATFRFATWAELSAQEYVESDRLDLEGLSDA